MLDLSDNPMGNVGASAVADMLAIDITLTTLNLSKCAIDDEEGSAIAGSLETKHISYDVDDLGQRNFHWGRDLDDRRLHVGRLCWIRCDSSPQSVHW